MPIAELEPETAVLSDFLFSDAVKERVVVTSVPFQFRRVGVIHTVDQQLLTVTGVNGL